jgi:hypothetical protein
MALLMEKTLALGQTDGTEARALYLQLQDGKKLLEDIQLDNQTGLALVAPDGTALANDTLPAEAIAAAYRGADEVRVGAKTYQVQSFPILGLDKQTGRALAISRCAARIRAHDVRSTLAHWLHVVARSPDHRRSRVTARSR